MKSRAYFGSTRLADRFATRPFVLPIDLMGNGALSPSVAGALSKLTLPILSETLKPVFDDKGSDADDSAFQEALSIARALVEACIRQGAAKLRAESIVLEAIAATGAGSVLELPMGMPFRPAIVKVGAAHILFVVHPRETDWCVTGIRKSGDSFEQRADLPAAWAGLSALAHLTGLVQDKDPDILRPLASSWRRGRGRADAKRVLPRA